MATIFLVGTYRVVVYPNDHRPAHVHVVGKGHARFLIGLSPDDVALVEQSDMSKADLRRVAEEIIDRHAECLAMWRRVHGDKP